MSLSQKTYDRRHFSLKQLVEFFPLSVIGVVLSSKGVLKIYLRCLAALFKCSIMGFSKNMSSISQWYEVMGLRTMKYGGWGYVFDGNFGSPNRSMFAVQHLSYGYLWNRLGGGSCSFISALLFLAVSVIALAQSDGILASICIVSLLAVCPIFVVGYFVNSKPENMAWPFVLLLLLGMHVGTSIWFCAALLMLIVYLSITAGLIAIALTFAFGGSHDLIYIYAAAPALIKLSVDVLASLLGGNGVAVLKRITGFGRRSACEEELGGSAHSYKRGVLTSPRRLCLLLVMLFPSALLLWSHSPLSIVSIVAAGLYIENCSLFRFADDSTFVRLALVINVIAMVGVDGWIGYTPIMVFFIKQAWIDNSIGMMDEGCVAAKPLEIIEKNSSFVEVMDLFMARLSPGSRILVEYDGEINRHRLRYLIYYLERHGYERDIELCPHEMTAAWYPSWCHDNYSSTTINSDPNHIKQLMLDCGATHLLLFSDGFAEKLGVCGFEAVGELNTQSAEMMHVLNVNGEECVKKVNLVSLPCSTGIVISGMTGLTVDSERSENQIQIQVEQEEGDLIVRYRYDSRWRASQCGCELVVTKELVRGLPFMNVCGAVPGEPVYMKYSGIVSFIR
jgi:hypothetical protein